MFKFASNWGECEEVWTLNKHERSGLWEVHEWLQRSLWMSSDLWGSMRVYEWRIEQFRKFVNECEKTWTIWKGMWLMWPTMRDCEWQVNMSDCEIFDQSLQVICEQKWGMICEWKPGMIWEWRAICEWQTSRSELCIFNKINYVHSMSDNVSSFVSPNQF